MKEGKLVHSTNSGRYAIDDPQTGDEIGKGQICDIFLGGIWIKGRIEHSGNIYASEGTAQQAYSGYYFSADNGGICGLCTNMKIRIPE
jgi:Domain of unknown function (DUF5348)